MKTSLIALATVPSLAMPAIAHASEDAVSLADQGTENSILVARRDYNEAVQAYNTRIRTFPDAIGAKIFYGAEPKVPFEAASGAQEAPDVNFNTAG